MKWAEMKPAERNALVAEKIGWQTRECQGELVEQGAYWNCSSCNLSGDWTGNSFDQFPGHLALPPAYSTDMNFAWEALKHAALGKPGYLADKRILSAEILMTLPKQDTANVHMTMGALIALTPESICKAILKAYGMEIE